MGSCPEPAPELTEKLRPKRGISQRATADGLFLLDVATGLCCELNALGARVWQELLEGGTLRLAHERILAEYEVSPEALEADLRELARELIDRRMLERA